MNKLTDLFLDSKRFKEMGKRSLFALSIPFYLITTSREKKYTYFITPKTGTRSILTALREASTPDIDDTTIIYIKASHKNRFKFCFIRNPWDRLVSCYSNKVLRKKLYPECWEKDFKYFIHYLTKQHLPTSDGHIRLQSTSFPINDIDYIGKFENFKEDFNYIINFKLKLNKDLVRLNPSKRDYYVDYYSNQTRKIVAELYKSDIELGNYIFGS
jgi:hypothetical protein